MVGAVARDRRRPRDPVRVLTAPGVVPADIRGFLSGLDDCLTKPFRVEELRAHGARCAAARAPCAGGRAGRAAESGPAAAPAAGDAGLDARVAVAPPAAGVARRARARLASAACS